MPCSASLQSTQRTLLPSTPLWHVALPAQPFQACCRPGEPRHSSTRRESLLPFFRRDHRVMGKPPKRVQHLARAGTAFFSPSSAQVPLLVPSPHTSPSPGQPEVSWRMAGSCGVLGVVCWDLGLQHSPEMPACSDLQRPPLSTHEPTGRALRMESHLAHGRILKRPRQNLSSVNPLLITFKGY